MPELPEVEHFRALLLPLKSSTENPIHLERKSLDKAPPRKFISDDDIARVNTGNFYVEDVLRKGKQIAMVLRQKEQQRPSKSTKKQCLYLMIHMGMTGRISTPQIVPKLKEVTNNDYPPLYAYLKFTCGTTEAYFSDPRKFGSIVLETSLDTTSFGSLAPDAWNDVSFHDMDNKTKTTTTELLLSKLALQSMGIKSLLLDQKRVVCGVGNWVADEVLYQVRMHPDQSYLTMEQARILLQQLHDILSTAIYCLVEADTEFPSDWLFHYRWNHKKTTQDAQGRVVTFVTSGGRTSAIVPSIQKLKSQKPVKTEKIKASIKTATTTTGSQTSRTATVHRTEVEKARKTSPHFDDKPAKKKKELSSSSPAGTKKVGQGPSLPTTSKDMNVETTRSSTGAVTTAIVDKSNTKVKSTRTTTTSRKRVKTEVLNSQIPRRRSPRLVSSGSYQ